MALHFYGMPVLVENNKPRLLYYLKNRGYRGFSVNRPDKHKNELSKAEKEIGGIPSSTSVIAIHAEAIESYIERYVGYDYVGEFRDADVPGKMFFNRTLLDWANYDITKRTKFDATVSSGFAIMATNKYVVKPQNNRKEISVKFARYSNKGVLSSILK